MMKKDQWMPWVEFFETECTSEEDIREVLNEVPKKYRLLVALALSAAHWHPSMHYRGGYANECALCILLGYDWDTETKVNCKKCPLTESPLKSCDDKKSVWKKWVLDISGHSENQMFRGLKKLYFAEYKKVMG
jgi:hypothetical protein